MRQESMRPPFPPSDDNAWAYWRARRMVRALRGWYIHLFSHEATLLPVPGRPAFEGRDWLDANWQQIRLGHTEHAAQAGR